MPDDYSTAQLFADIMAVIQDNAPTIVAVALFVAVVNFVVNWFHYSLSVLVKRPFDR